MTDLSDIDMTGVKPIGDHQDLPIGTYAVRIEDTEKTATKEKYDEAGNKMPQAYYLKVDYKVYGGPNDGQVDKTNLNLWNPSDDAVRIAKSELKSIQDATGVHPRPDAQGIMRFMADWLHGAWMMLEVKPNSRDSTKTIKRYSQAPEAIVKAFVHVPPVPAKTPVAQHQPAAAVTHVSPPPPAAAHTAAATVAHVAQPAAAAPAAASGADELPDWAKPKK